MTADPPDEPPDEPPDDAGGYDPVLDAELDRLAALYPVQRREYPKDLVALMHAIGERAAIRLGSPHQPPFQFDRYEIFDSTFGGMGMVLKGRDPKLDRKVAIKLWMTKGPKAEAALLAEAKILAKLSHQNVVTIYDTGRWEDRVYFVMQWVEGRDAHKWMRERVWPWWVVRDVFVQAGRGLAAAHDAGIQHRDFKPSNILVDHDGRAFVADFGVADLLRGAPDAAESGQLAGTPTYMAPERLRGERGDARSDQFSFCVALWQALFRVRPFAGETSEELLASMESGAMRWNPKAAPAWLAKVAVEGLALDPTKRYADMHDLVDALLDEPDDNGQTKGESEGNDEPGGDGERVLHSPARATGETRLTYLNGLMTGIVASAVFMVGLLLLAPRGDRDRPEPERSSPIVDKHAGDSSSTSTTPEKVIQKIQEGEYEEAHSLWLDETTRRDMLGVPTHADSIRIGRAYLQQARGRPYNEALRLAALADLWARAARDNLNLYEEPPQPGDDLVEEVREFGASLVAAP